MRPCRPRTSVRGTRSYAAGVTDTRARLLRAVHRDGVHRVLKRAAAAALSRLYVRESHVWIALRLDEERPRPSLPEGYVMSRGGVANLPALDGLGVDVQQAAQRLADGTELWLIWHSRDVVYSGWVFHGSAPTIAGPHGRVRLPPGSVNPEDMVTSPAHQGRGLASAAYRLIFDDLQRTGRANQVLGKVPLDNTANRRAVQKAGWLEFAVVCFTRLGPWSRTTVRALPAEHGPLPPGAAELTSWLTAAMRA